MTTAFRKMLKKSSRRYEAFCTTEEFYREDNYLQYGYCYEETTEIIEEIYYYSDDLDIMEERQYSSVGTQEPYSKLEPVWYNQTDKWGYR